MSRGGTIRPNPGFDANTVAENLKRAMKGFGTDEKTIIEELTKISNSQRQMVREAYTGMYGDDLIDALKSELGGHFEDVIIALMEETSKYDAKQLHDAMRGFGTKESLLIEIVCSRTDDELAAIRDVYEEMYGESLKDAIEGDTTGDFENLLVSLVVGERAGEQYVDPTKAKEDAQALYDAGEGKWFGTDESVFNSILASQSFRQLERVFREYEEIAGHTIETAIRSEFSGDVEKGFLALVQCIQSTPRYFAERLHDAMAGLGTSDQDLIRIIVSRSEVDLKSIKHEYESLYETPLVDAIKSECSGDYRRALVAIVEGN